MIKSKHIVIITGQHMISNPRVWKEANALCQNGYEVTILTTWHSAKKLEADYTLLNPKIRYIASVNLIREQTSSLNYLWSKGLMRLANWIKTLFNFDSLYLITYRPYYQAKKAMTLNADLYIGHQETGLIIGSMLLQQGKKVAFDFEDWYSRDYLNKSRPINMLKKFEHFALSNAIYCSCPSKAMSNSLKKVYQSNVPLVIIYNGFSITENKQLNKKINHIIPHSLVWFSQTIGINRGLETLIKALKLLQHPLQLHLIGDCDTQYRKKLEDSFPYGLGHQLYIHDKVLHPELLAILIDKQIGLAIENNYPDNKDKTISNKILQYIQAGIKVLATSTQGQEEVASYFPETVKTVHVEDPVDWVKKIEWLLNSPDVNIEKQSDVFNEFFSWEAQESKLLDAMNLYAV